MRLADHYDVICAGSGLSSYLCAALLAKAGKRVLVIDDEDHALARVSSGDCVFDPDFALFGGLEESAALGRSLKELGLMEEQPSSFRPFNEITQVLTSDHRIVFWKDSGETCREVRRELKGSSDSVCEFFAMLYEAGGKISSFVENAVNPGQAAAGDVNSWKKFWGKYYSAIHRQHPLALREALAGQSAEECEHLSAALLGALSYAAPVNLGFEQGIRGLTLPFRGLYYYLGGLDALKEKLGAIVVGSGGGIKKDARVESLIAEDKKIAGVLLSSFEGIIRADIVVLSSRLRKLYATLPAQMQDPSLLRMLGRIEPNSWRYTIAVTVNKKVLPIGATSNMIYVGSYQLPLQEENYLRIQILPDEACAENVQPETATLLLTALVPYRASSMDYGYLRRLGGRMLQTLAELFPFLEENIVKIFPDIRAGEDSLRSFYPFNDPEWVPENLIQYYLRGHKQAQDFWGPSWTTPHSNLYLAGRAIWPALGIYGEALTARKIFDDVMLPTR